MSRAHRTTESALASWMEAQRVIRDSVIRLVPDHAEGALPVCEWTADELGDRETWVSKVAELARNDAESRGQTTRYLVRHTVGDRTIGQHAMRVLVQRQGMDASELDGSQHSMNVQMQRHVERLQQTVATMANNAVEAQGKSLALLGQAYTVIAAQQAEIAELRALAGSALREAPEQEKREPDAFETLLTEVVGPAIKEKISGMASTPDPAKAMLSALGLPPTTNLKRLGAMLGTVLTETEADDGESPH